MSIQVPHCVLRMLLLLIVVSLAVAEGRPNHFGDTNQVVADQDSNNLWDTLPKPLQLEALLRQYELSNQAGGDYDLALRRPEIKRQSRYRQCYFNPISCFRK